MAVYLLQISNLCRKDTIVCVRMILDETNKLHMHISIAINDMILLQDHSDHSFPDIRQIFRNI